jgi:hypothetical protein
LVAPRFWGYTVMRTIAEIDRDINRLRKAKALPARYDEECALFRERGLTQLERDQKAEQLAVRRASRPLKKRKCPSCGSAIYEAAVSATQGTNKP